MLGHAYLVDMLILAPKNRRKTQQSCQLITHINSLLEKDPNSYVKEKKDNINNPFHPTSFDHPLQSISNLALSSSKCLASSSINCQNIVQ